MLALPPLPLYPLVVKYPVTFETHMLALPLARSLYRYIRVQFFAQQASASSASSASSR